MQNWKRNTGAVAPAPQSPTTAPKQRKGGKAKGKGQGEKGKSGDRAAKADDRFRRDDSWRDDRARRYDDDRNSRSGHSDHSDRRRTRDTDDDVFQDQQDLAGEWDEFAWQFMRTQGKLLSMVCQRLGDVEVATQRSWMCETADVTVAACVQERKDYSERNRGKSGHGEGPPDQWVFKVFCESMVTRLDETHPSKAPLKLLVDTLTPEQAVVQVKTFRFKRAFSSKHTRLVASFHPTVDLTVGNAVSAALKHVGFPELLGRAPTGHLEGQLSRMTTESQP